MEWISANQSDTLPKGMVIAYNKQHGVYTVGELGRIKDSVYCFLYGNIFMEVNYWMPLPEPPKEDA